MDIPESVAKNEGFENEDLSPLFPGVGGEACFETGLIEESPAVPSVLDRNLGKEEALVVSACTPPSF